MFKQLFRTYITRPRLVAPSTISPSITPDLLTSAPTSTSTSTSTSIISKQNKVAQRSPNRWLPHRTGVIGKKIGMAPLFDPETGHRIACTILELNNVEVLLHRTPERNGYWALQVGYGNLDNPLKETRQMLGHFAEIGVNPKEKICEFQFSDSKGLLPVGTLLKPSFFKLNQFVDCQSVSKGKGFAGVMKRHNFKGQPASHGTSLTHRHGGSYGQHQDPGRVLPGKKMPGRMGGHNVTLQNLQVMKIDDINNVLWIKGAVPGPKGSFVKIQDSIKKPPTL